LNGSVGYDVSTGRGAQIGEEEKPEFDHAGYAITG